MLETPAESESSIVGQALRSGAPIPERFLKAPVLTEGLRLYLNAFFDLDTERVNGMSIGRIPMSAVRQYAAEFGFDEEQYYALTCHIKAMDAAYIGHFQKDE
jgi:hypothetical protein